MKIETKRRIVRAVKALLNYSVTKDTALTIPVQVSRIRKVQSKQMYSKKDLLMIEERTIEFSSVLQIVEELNKNKLIKFDKISCENKEFINVIAEIRVIEPS